VLEIFDGESAGFRMCGKTILFPGLAIVLNVLG